MEKDVKKFSKKCIDNFALTTVGLFLILYVFYVLIMRDNIVMPIHDNLDSNVVWFKMLKDNKAFFTYNRTYLPFLGGFDRNLMSTNLDIYAWFFMLMPVSYAAMFASIFRIIVSVAGMCILFREILDIDIYEEVKNIIVFLGFSFGIFPLFLSGQLGVAFLPLFLYFCIKLYKTGNLRWGILLVLYAFCSHLILYGLFVCAYFVIFIIVDTVKNKKVNFSLICTFVSLCVAYVVSQWRLFAYQMYGEESIRSSFNDTSFVIKNDFFKSLFNAFFKGDVEAGELYTLLIVPLSIAAFLYLTVRLFRKKTVLFYKEIVLLEGLCIFNALMYAVETKSNLIYIITKNISDTLSTINYSRFLYLSPFLWYMAFGLIIVNIVDTYKSRGKIVSYALVLATVIIIFVKPATYNLVQQNIKHIKEELTGNSSSITFDNFYAERMFNEIKNDLNYDSEWAVAYGFHPAVLEYNHISTLDGYSSTYSKSYKEQFRKLITPYEQAGGYLSYFDNWGGRAYIFGDVDYLSYYNTDPAEIHIDSAVFKEMNGKYVISRVEITNCDENSLEFINKYEDDSTVYKHMYVYRVK